MTAEQNTVAETKRDRVRRLFIHPMIEHGWRKPGNVKQEAHDAMLVKLADALNYLTDESFATLRECMRTKGTGSGMNGWPTLATVLTYAELVQVRPIDEMPNLLSWFRSAAGQAAEAEGRLVEEYGWWCKHKSPPYAPHHHRMVADRAADNRRRVELITDQLRRGATPAPGEREWLHRYQERKAHVRRLMSEGSA